MKDNEIALNGALFKPMDEVAMARPVLDADGVYEFVPAIVTDVVVKDGLRNLVEYGIVYLDGFLVVDARVSESDLRKVKDVKDNFPKYQTRNLTDHAFCELHSQVMALL